MKKFFYTLLCTALFSVLLSCHAFAGNFETGVGDADADGKITTGDVLTIRRMLVGLLPDNVYIDMDASDVDSSGEVSSSDIIHLRKYLAGMEDIADIYGHVNSGYPVGRYMVCGREICDYVILIPENANDNITLFSSKLAEHIEKMTGFRLPVVTSDDGSPAIEIIPDLSDEYGLGDEGYIITTERERVTVIGGRARGCMYGILDLLRDYMGVSFNSTGTVYPKHTRMTLEEGIVSEWIPALEYRCVRVSGYSGTNLENFLIPNKTNALETNTYLHSTRYGNGLGRTFSNAHSFSVLIESCDDYHQPCLTNEAIYEECVDSVLALIEQRSAYGYVIGEDMNQISCSLNDNTDYCTCVECKRVTVQEGSLAGPLIHFVNRVSHVVEEEYPDIDIFTIAYYEFRIPPKTVDPAKNLIICYCWNGCNNHTFGSGECKDPFHFQINYNNNDEEKYFLGWADKTDKLYVWYYVTNFIYHMAPSPNVYNIYYDLSWLYDNGACGVFVEGSGNNTFEALKGYLSAKMEENPMMTLEEYCELMNLWLERTYGPGWESILKYIDMQTAAGDASGCFVNNFEMPFDMYDRQYMAEHYKEMEALFESAYAAAKTDTQRYSIRKTSVHMYFLCLSARYESDYVNGTEESRSSWLYDYQNKLYKYAKEYGAGTGSSGKIPETNAVTGSPTFMWYGDETGSRGSN